ncbi:MAG: Hpt domain-containing protein [Treponema sp.]|jgi:signal transduction histidine kinase/HPt (histidine-containing phosphotransfer) domain-containing protein|nr:Hpt domain-containing protein [Treponema sp.]
MNIDSLKKNKFLRPLYFQLFFIIIALILMVTVYRFSITPEREFYRELRSPEFVLFLLGFILAAVLIIVLIQFDLVKRKKDEEKKQTEAASYAKSVFLVNMSNEMRTPVNSIMGFAQLALDYECSQKTKDCIEKISRNTEWLLQIVDEILDISKIESGKLELEHIPFNMDDLFAVCQTLITPKASEKGIMLHFYPEPFADNMPLGDPVRLRQVFLHLLSNAVKFTNNGIIKLTAAIKESREKSVTIYFEVTDTGIGMESAQIEKISAPFMQTGKYGGTGLGLPLTINIIKMMGGKLSIESSPGLGSKFSFELVFKTVKTAAGGLNNNNVINDTKKPLIKYDLQLQSGLLKLFHKTNQKKCEEIINALKAGDVKNAHILVHSLKSNAGQIGKTSLQKTASSIELLLKDGVNQVTEEQMKQLENELSAVLSQIESEFPEEESRAGSINNNAADKPVQAVGGNDLMDENAARELIDNLEAMLKMGSSDCLKLIDKIRCLPDITNKADNELKLKLIQQIDDFEFTQAMDTLAKIKENLAWNGEQR